MKKHTIEKVIDLLLPDIDRRKWRNSLIRSRDKLTTFIEQLCCDITLNYNLTVAEGSGNPSLIIEVNGVQVVNLTSTGSGSITVHPTDIIHVVVDSDNTNCNYFDVSAEGTVDVDCANEQYNGCIDGTFEIDLSHGKTYTIDAFTEADGTTCGE